MTSMMNWNLLSAEERSTMSITLQMETIRKREKDHKRATAKAKQEQRRKLASADKQDAVDELLNTLLGSDLPGLSFVNRTDVNYVPLNHEKEDLVVYLNVSAVDRPVRVFLYSSNASVKVHEVAEKLHRFYSRIDESKCHSLQAVMTGVEFSMVPRLLEELEQVV